jgi:hypothetical protein
VWELQLAAENQACDRDRELESKCSDGQQRADYTLAGDEAFGEDIQTGGASGARHLGLAYADRIRLAEAVAQGSCNHLSHNLRD